MFLLSGVAFNRDHQLTAESRPAIAVAAAAINMQESLKVYVVGHLQGTDSLQSLVDHSTRRADQDASTAEDEDAVEDQGATTSEDGSDDAADESEADYDEMIEQMAEQALQAPRNLRRPAPRPATPAEPVYTESAKSVAKAWHQREGILGPHKQQRLFE